MTSILRQSKLWFTVTSLGLVLLMSGTSRAAIGADTNGGTGTVSLDQPAYTANENQGTLAITVQRTGDLSQAEHVGYGVKRQDAQPGIDFDTIPTPTSRSRPGRPA